MEDEGIEGETKINDWIRAGWRRKKAEKKQKVVKISEAVFIIITQWKEWTKREDHVEK